VTWLFTPENIKPIRAWLEWMKEEGKAGQWSEIEWDSVSFAGWSPEEIRSLETAIGAFISTHASRELEKASLKRGLFLAPVNDIDQVAGDEQFASRNYWKELNHSELEATLTYPRFTYLSTEGENEVRFRGPLIGEHNNEIYGQELGFSEETIASLREQGIL
jgi:crotonobetainyl-CoA:carnitine CoA-transferase CaiB-like acyl-CoA transferase